MTKGSGTTGRGWPILDPRSTRYGVWHEALEKHQRLLIEAEVGRIIDTGSAKPLLAWVRTVLKRARRGGKRLPVPVGAVTKKA
jgi:hypothetical protein